jgi:hypothetical protein
VEVFLPTSTHGRPSSCIYADIQTPHIRMSPRVVTGKYAITFVAKHAHNGTLMQLEGIIFSTNLTNKPSPQQPCIQILRE